MTTTPKPSRLRYDTNLRKKMRQRLFRGFEYEIQTQRAGFSHWLVNYRKLTNEILELIDQHIDATPHHQEKP